MGWKVGGVVPNPAMRVRSQVQPAPKHAHIIRSSSARHCSGRVLPSEGNQWRRDAAAIVKRDPAAAVIKRAAATAAALRGAGQATEAFMKVK